ncbi:sugar phosphate nucleotidyltransferase [Paenibacillus senegalensis]|uniref:sugar phosphate nucleotidyltransferase n=1 Tax=Paenibacillus senegalensis TaxID=1465766 RepID=UPI000287B853|nr:sugar phosphate nucleotidyltransferase [Paenibacillus senegalensis]
MKLIMLSGGSGKRLWPLSNEVRSKQFLRILPAPDGDKESMLERIWRQLRQAGLSSDVHIATGKAQVDMVQSQLGSSVPLIIEPERKDTFPAIALAAVYLYSMRGVGLDEVITVFPGDPYVEDAFFREFKKLGQVLAESGADLALIGVQPTYPSEKYGYIVPDMSHARHNMAASSIKVKRFTEKPCKAEASELLKQSALWNCGVFAFRLGYLIQLLIDARLPIQYEEMLKQYGAMEAISFDYKVVEQAQKVVVCPYDGCWKDLGTWNTLTEEMSDSTLGAVRMTEDSRNTHVINELGIPVVVLGISDAVIAASPDGILVSEKGASPRLKDMLSPDKQRPMYEERRWGYYHVLDSAVYPDGKKVMTKRVHLRTGQNFSYHYHNFRSEVWTVLSGEGHLIQDGHFRKVEAGDVVYIPAGSRHSLFALQTMEIVEVMRGTRLDEEDSVRLDLLWETIRQLSISGS